MSLRHLLRRSTTIRSPIPISHIQQRLYNISISPANEDPLTSQNPKSFPSNDPISYPQFPLRTMTFSSAETTPHTRSPCSSTPTPTPAQKRMILSKLKASSERCDDLLREIEEEGGFQISKPDLKRWARLFQKQGQSRKSIDIYFFMEWKYLCLRNKYKPCAAIIAPTSLEESSARFKVKKKSSGSIKPEKGKVEKRKVFQKLKSLTIETIDLILKEEEKKGVLVTQEDLVSWAKRLDKRNRKPENALEIFRWMDKKKMLFSPSQLELYVDLLGKVKGPEAAQAYFHKVEPNFNEMDANAKNLPAFLKMLHWFEVTEQKNPSSGGPKKHVLIYPKCDDNWNLY